MSDDAGILDGGKPTILRKDQYKLVNQLYQLTLKALGVAGTPNAYATTEIEDLSKKGDHDGGVSHLQSKLQHVFNKLGTIPHFEDRSAETQKWLSELSRPTADGSVRPDSTIGELLKKMFGSDALQMYGEGKWKVQSHAPETHAPEDNAQPGKDSTSEPMANQMGDQMPPPDGGMGGMPPGGDPMGGGGMGGPPMDPSMMGGDPSMGGMPPMDPSMMGMDPSMMGGMPPDPNQALQGPGGPFPKPPPGGLPMA